MKTPNQCPRFAIRMKYRGGEGITPLPLTQDMISDNWHLRQSFEG